MKKNYLITGAAGFIGFHISKKLLEKGENVIGIDNMNNYYDLNLKKHRLFLLKKFRNFVFVCFDISDKKKLTSLFKKYQFEYVINFAAQAGVRYSITNPDEYINSNIIGFYNILEMCRFFPVKHLIYASSSSVYGASKKNEFEEIDNVDNPVSLYAATKKSNELIAYSYSHLYGIPTTGLRFFTVYGPLGRPDMAYYSFTNNFFKNKEIEIYNNGDFKNDLYRDFTYIEDVVDAIEKIIKKIPKKENDYRILNIGNNKPEKLMVFIKVLEESLSKSLNKSVVFNKKFVKLKKEDVKKTYASIRRIKRLIEYNPKTDIREGLQKFADWYVEYHITKKRYF